jgi:hypothetical protein
MSSDPLFTPGTTRRLYSPFIEEQEEKRDVRISAGLTREHGDGIRR